MRKGYVTCLSATEQLGCQSNVTLAQFIPNSQPDHFLYEAVEVLMKDTGKLMQLLMVVLMQ
jgi:hypothetical protein